MIQERQSASQLARELRSGERTAVDVMEEHLRRIETANPVINALVAIDAEAALEQAQAADAMDPAERKARPLHGLPLAVKDTANAVGFATTQGSLRYAKAFPDADDLHVARLRAAGAIVVGKSNVPEHAAGSHSFNRVFGATVNPYDPSKIAGGSSGGAAAALAAGMVALADGSDMGGSLRNPAALCGVVGLRPTPGVVPNTYSDVFTPLSTAGPMGRTPEDVALMLDVMGRPSELDPGSWAAPDASNDAAPSLRGLRVAVSPDVGGAVAIDPELSAAIEAMVAPLEDAGATVIRSLPDLEGSEQVFRTLRAAEFAAAFGEDLLSGREEFVDFFEDNIRQGFEVSGADVVKAQERMTALVRGTARYFGDVDLLITPATTLPAFDANTRYPSDFGGAGDADYLEWMKASWLFTPLGIPALSLPVGLTRAGLPVGAQLASARNTDRRLLALAGLVAQLPSLSIPAPMIGASS